MGREGQTLKLQSMAVNVRGIIKNKMKLDNLDLKSLDKMRQDQFKILCSEMIYMELSKAGLQPQIVKLVMDKGYQYPIMCCHHLIDCGVDVLVDTNRFVYRIREYPVAPMSYEILDEGFLSAHRQIDDFQ